MQSYPSASRPSTSAILIAKRLPASASISSSPKDSCCSAVTGAGLDALLEAAWHHVTEARREAPPAPPDVPDDAWLVAAGLPPRHA